MNNHMLQYAEVGGEMVANTESLTDEQIRAMAKAREGAMVERFNRCPVCQIWTHDQGRLREGLDCPAIRAQAAKEGR